MGAFSVTVRDDGVAMVVWDQPGASVNTLSRDVLGEFEEEVLPWLDEPAVKAAVLASGKTSTFVAGADLKELDGVAEASEAEAFSRRGHALLNRVARGRTPVVGAIHGAAIGGGLEVALACHALVASDDPATVLSLPEVMLGLLPGGGGTQRLPRRIGLPAALPMLLTGQRVRARKALRLGLVDAVTTPGGIADTAARLALTIAAGQTAVRRPLARGVRLLTFSPLRWFVLTAARRQVMRKTRGLYPAPLAILDCVRIGLGRGEAAGEEAESQGFGRLTVSRPARSLIFLFHAGNALKKPSAGASPRPVHRLGVLGGGFMGAGVAGVSLAACPVVVKDVADDVLSRCVKGIAKGLDKQVASGALRPVERDERLSRLALTSEVADLAGCDLVVEAVFEELELKRRVLAEAEAVVAPEAVFASNTSALPIAAIAGAARHPERVLGMHYFSPVHQMPLLELVVAERTASWAVDTAWSFATAQGKTVIVVRDGPGFYTTRILAAYLNEAMVVLEEGAAIDQVDRALRQFGFPVGPLALLDEVGIDVGAHVARDLGQAFAARGVSSSPVLPRLQAAGLLGRKRGRGFYLYPAPGKRGRKRINPVVYEHLAPSGRAAFASADIAERLALTMVNEAAMCLGERVIASPRDGDVGAVMGLGFPPFRGGPFHHVDAVGAGAIVARLEDLAARHGARFSPADALAEMARTSRRFYGP
ncbi:MAG: 3-hydroxyacyl-CoA dehydrogenase NAD-binding domain-containing protein [Acidobacteriota bacterium]